MNEVLDSEDLLTRFLLDEVDERERAEVEDRLLSDPDFYEQMLVVEGDLTDSYVREDLSTFDRERFEKSFLSSARRRKRVEFAQGLADSTTQLYREEFATPRSRRTPALSAGDGGWLASLFASRPVLGYAVAAAVIVAIGVTVWIAVERMRSGVQNPEVRTEGPAPQQSGSTDGGVSARKDETPSSPPRDSASPGITPTPGGEGQGARPVFATITLVPGSLRDGAAGANLFIPRGSTHLRLHLQLEEDNYRRYNAVLSTPEGRKIWAGSARKNRTNDARFVTLTLPATSLARGDFVVELTGIGATGRPEPAAQYSFRVTRKD